MSRIAWFCIPAWGHTNPTVEVVRQLTARGHQVRYYSFEAFREKLEAAGAEVILCEPYLPPAPEDLDKKVGKDFAALIEMAADTTISLEETVCRDMAEFWPDVIVSDSVCFWGKLFAWKLGVPYVCSTTTFAFNQHTAPLMKPRLGEMARSILGMPRIQKKMELLRRHGYPVKQFTDLIQNDNDTRTIVYTSRAFQPMAETFSDEYAFVGPSLAPVTADSTEKRRPLVYVSLGTVMNRRVDFYRACFAALGGEDLDVVLSVGEDTDIAALGPIPANFRVEHRVDQMAVLARADVFLTHCGMNSASEAVWSGVPTVLFPQQSEEGAVATRMEQLGLGLRLKRAGPTAIRQAVLTVLADGTYREANRKMGDTFRAAGGAKTAADFLETVIRDEN